MLVRWTATALRNLTDQLDYIAERNLMAARRLRTEIRRHTEMLLDTPEIGRTGRLSGTRELVISGTPYVAVYRIRGKVVMIFRLLHGAQEWPARQKK